MAYRQNIDYYSRFAPSYELFFSDFDRSVTTAGKALFEILERDTSIEILDACCGTGRQALALAQLGFRVTGADPCTRMLGRAEQLSREYGVHIELVHADF